MSCVSETEARNTHRTFAVNYMYFPYQSLEMPGTKNVSLLETDKRTSKVPSRWCVTLAPEHTRQLLVLFLHNSPHKLDFKKVESQLLLAMITNSAVQSSTRTPIYRPQQSCKGYVFTGICLSTWGGGVCCLSACWDTMSPPRADTPPGSRHPPRSRYPCAGADTPPSRHPLSPERQPLLQTVRILLECILVTMLFCS